MFDCCDPDEHDTSAKPGMPQTLDLHESSQVIIALLRLLHEPLGRPIEEPSEADSFISSQLHRTRYNLSTVVPLPLITTMIYELVDKYALSETMVDTLWLHVEAHAATDPLQVYAFATLHGMHRTASNASQYMAPLASYRSDQVKAIPTLEAYHKLVQLQDLRLKGLKKLLLSEDLFPHGYGKCSVHHVRATTIWDAQRKALAIRVDTGIDIAGEMTSIANDFDDCAQCSKAFTAAIGMLSVNTLPTHWDSSAIA
ncbi:hypothetical protein AX17_000632 [Amanita inopinata Kibby_2008]|nr:hypothetical protein AX17_000632 [Amanita inopinata Kibby_2008]